MSRDASLKRPLPHRRRDDDGDDDVVDKKPQKQAQSQVVSFPVDSETDNELLQSVKAKSSQSAPRTGGFESMNLMPALYRAVKKKGYRVPTPIQRKCIPLLMSGHDVVAMARTGSGKTAAFLLPLFQKLAQHETTIGVRAIVLSPTRELALQTADFIRALSQFTDLRSCVLVGGDSISIQFSDLSANPDIIIATPGRLMQVLIETELNLREVRFVVFDEADRLFEMGFAEQLNELLTRLPESRQSALFSATLPNELVSFARAGLRAPQLVRLDTDVRVSDNLSQAFFVCRANEKTAALLWLLQNHLDPRMHQTIVFGATRYIVEYLSELLNECGYDCAYVYGAMDATARKINLARFRNGSLRVLCVTDLAARGIDVPMLDFVVNYDVAARPKTFVHRVGRVARAGRSGTAFSLISTEELPLMVELFTFLGHQVKQLPLRANTPDAANYRLTPSDVHYGRVAQVSLDANDQIIREAHARKIELRRVLHAADNAQKLVVKTRPLPGRASLKRAKLLKITDLHPLCVADGNADATIEQGRHALLAGMRSFRPRATVFELNNDRQSAINVMMQNKRSSHQAVIQNVRNNASKREAADDDEQPLERNVTTNDDEDDEDEVDQGDDNDESSDTNDATSRKKSVKARDDDDDDDDGIQFWADNNDDDVDEIADEFDDGDDDLDDFNDDDVGDVDVNGVDNDQGEQGGVAAIAVLASSSSTARMSKHQRRLMRMKAQQSDAATTHDSKRRRVEKSSSAYRDPSFFMGYTQSNESAANAYAIDGESAPKPLVKGAVPLDSILMEEGGGEALAADDAKGLARKDHVRRWDRGRKKFVNVAPGVNPNDKSQTGRRLKLDDGRVVKAVSTGKYQEWQKKSHKRIGEVGENEEELMKSGTINAPASRSGLAIKAGRVVTGRLRASMPQGVMTFGGSDDDDGTGAREANRFVKVGAPKSLMEKAAGKGGELATAATIAKERKKHNFKRMMAKHGLEKTRQIQDRRTSEARETAREKRQNRSTKKGFGAMTMSEFRRKHVPNKRK